jgi:hypothetical protein
MANIKTSEMDAKLAQSWGHEFLYADKSSTDEQLLMQIFLSKTKNRNVGSRFKVKICSVFYGDNS